MRHCGYILITALFVFLCACSPGGMKQSQAVSGPSITWLASLAEGQAIAGRTKKSLMVDFYADWCGWCKKLDRDVYTDPDVMKLAENVICVKINSDDNPAEAKRYGVRGLPTIIFMNPDGSVRERFDGYREKGDFIRALSRGNQ